MAADWSREEVEATVADYLAMFETELAGVPYDKTEHRRQLLPKLDARSEGSIEFKHQNISAVLIALGFPYISGYKPRSNYQGLLHEVVSDRLASNRGLIALVEADADRIVSVPTVDDILKVLTDPPNPKTTGPRASERIPQYLPRPVNYLEREARNRTLGLAGEEFVINFERARLIGARREVLASKIEHVSKVRGNAEGFDILSFDTSGAERLIEVKTTKYGQDTPFFVSRNELDVSQARSERYHLYRLFAFRENPHLFTLCGALSTTCNLDATNYIASVA
ncbi:MAG: DUF3883 domain-containing protein [Burkholderiales bacterium]